MRLRTCANKSCGVLAGPFPASWACESGPAARAMAATSPRNETVLTGELLRCSRARGWVNGASPVGGGRPGNPLSLCPGGTAQAIVFAGDEVGERLPASDQAVRAACDEDLGRPQPGVVV